jgi:hypothetical protein
MLTTFSKKSIKNPASVNSKLYRGAGVAVDMTNGCKAA